LFSTTRNKKKKEDLPRFADCLAKKGRKKGRGIDSGELERSLARFGCLFFARKKPPDRAWCINEDLEGNRKSIVPAEGGEISFIRRPRPKKKKSLTRERLSSVANKKDVVKVEPVGDDENFRRCAGELSEKGGSQTTILSKREGGEENRLYLKGT